MLALTFLSKTQYQATVTVQVNAPPPQEVPLYSQYGRAALNDEIEQTRNSFTEFLLEGDAPYQAIETLPDPPMSGGELRRSTTIDNPNNSQLMRVKVSASDPETAALLANTLVESGLEQYGQLLAQPTANTREFIERELETARQELESAEANLAQFQITNKIRDLDSAIDGQSEFIRSLRKQGDLARAAGDTIQAQEIESMIPEREAELQNMIGLSAEYNELVSLVDQARATHNFLQDKRSEAQIKENQIRESTYIQIITPARAPRNPVAAINSKLFVLGGVVSILAGVLFAFFLEYLSVSGVFARFGRLYEVSQVTPVPENES